MSTNTKSKVDFVSLKKMILKNKDHAVVKKDEDSISLHYEGLMYSIDPDKNETINFDTLGMDFTLNSKNELLILDDEDGKITFPLIKEGLTKETIVEYLAWRVRALDRLNF